MNAIKCLLFDSDGTLVDSEELSNRAISMKFAEVGVTLETEQLLRTYRGWKLAGIFAELAEKNHINLPDNFEVQYRHLVAQLFEQELRPIPGICGVLDKLPLPKAVVSNGPMHKISQALHICHLADYFSENIFSAYEVNYFKPDPAIYLHSALQMGFHPSECAVIEDSLTGVAAGAGAKMSVFFFNRYGEHCPFENVIEFSDMRELPSLIGRTDCHLP